MTERRYNGWARARAWAREQQFDYPCPEHHERAIRELGQMLVDVPTGRAVEIGAGPSSAMGTMLRGLGWKWSATVSDAHELGLHRGGVDLIVARHVLEHTLSPVAALLEMRRVAKLALIVVPKDEDRFLSWGGHLNVWPRRQWEAAFWRVGWAIARFEEGDFSVQAGTGEDVEWRYLLAWTSEPKGYRDDGMYLGRLPALAKPWR